MPGTFAARLAKPSGTSPVAAASTSEGESGGAHDGGGWWSTNGAEAASVVGCTGVRSAGGHHPFGGVAAAGDTVTTPTRGVGPPSGAARPRPTAISTRLSRVSVLRPRCNRCDTSVPGWVGGPVSGRAGCGLRWANLSPFACHIIVAVLGCHATPGASRVDTTAGRPV